MNRAGHTASITSSKSSSARLPRGGEPVTFQRYTGQDREASVTAVLRNPPDILLTNYVMLELVLTRPEERRR